MLAVVLLVIVFGSRFLDAGKDKYLSATQVSTQHHIFAPDRAAILKYWCWRAKYCRTSDELVCASDKRLRQSRRFRGECAVFKQNCENGTDFTVTTAPSC